MNTTGCLISKLPPMDKREGRAKHGTGGRQPWERLRWKVSHDVSVAVLRVVPRKSSSFLEETTVLFHLESSKNHLDDFSGEFSQVIMSFFLMSPALQPNSKRTICDWQRLGPATWISDRVLPTWFPESINRPQIRAGVLKISRGTDNVKSSCTHRQSTRKRTCANLLTIVPTVIAAQ